MATQDFQQAPRGQQGAGLSTWVARSTLLESGGGWKRRPFLRALLESVQQSPLTLLLLLLFLILYLVFPDTPECGLAGAPSLAMDCNRGARPLEGSTTSLGAPWTGKKGCSGRAGLWDSPTQCKVLGVPRSHQQSDCEEGLSVNRKPAGEAWMLTASTRAQEVVSRSPGPSLIPTQLSCHLQKEP